VDPRLTYVGGLNALRWRAALTWDEGSEALSTFKRTHLPPLEPDPPPVNPLVVGDEHLSHQLRAFYDSLKSSEAGISVPGSGPERDRSAGGTLSKTLSPSDIRPGRQSEQASRRSIRAETPPHPPDSAASLNSTRRIRRKVEASTFQAMAPSVQSRSAAR
jgi:hypothetical protein